MTELPQLRGHPTAPRFTDEDSDELRHDCRAGTGRQRVENSAPGLYICMSSCSPAALASPQGTGCKATSEKEFSPYPTTPMSTEILIPFFLPILQPGGFYHRAGPAIFLLRTTPCLVPFPLPPQTISSLASGPHSDNG